MKLLLPQKNNGVTLHTFLLTTNMMAPLNIFLTFCCSAAANALAQLLALSSAR